MLLLKHQLLWERPNILSPHYFHRDYIIGAIHTKLFHINFPPTNLMGVFGVHD